MKKIIVVLFISSLALKSSGQAYKIPIGSKVNELSTVTLAMADGIFKEAKVTNSWQNIPVPFYESNTRKYLGDVDCIEILTKNGDYDNITTLLLKLNNTIVCVGTNPNYSPTEIECIVMILKDDVPIDIDYGFVRKSNKNAELKKGTFISFKDDYHISRFILSITPEVYYVVPNYSYSN